MKKTITLSMIAMTMLLSCSKNKYASTTPGNDMVDTVNAVLKYSGTLIGEPFESATGIVNIYLKNGQYTLQLKNFQSSNGPDLHVYLSQERFPVHFIDLGNLHSVSGNQVYTIPGMPDFTLFKYALVHCQQFNHLFGSAELM